MCSGFIEQERNGQRMVGHGGDTIWFHSLLQLIPDRKVGVFLSYITARGHALIDRELYLPEEWCSDLPRRQAAHIPDTVTFATKPELAQRMVQRAHDAHLPLRWVVADTVYGHCPDLRAFLEEQGDAYALAVPSTEVVCVQTKAGPLLADVGSLPQRALSAKDWQRLSQVPSFGRLLMSAPAGTKRAATRNRTPLREADL